VRSLRRIRRTLRRWPSSRRPRRDRDRGAGRAAGRARRRAEAVEPPPAGRDARSRAVAAGRGAMTSTCSIPSCCARLPRSAAKKEAEERPEALAKDKLKEDEEAQARQPPARPEAAATCNAGCAETVAARCRATQTKPPARGARSRRVAKRTNRARRCEPARGSATRLRPRRSRCRNEFEAAEAAAPRAQNRELKPAHGNTASAAHGQDGLRSCTAGSITVGELAQKMSVKARPSSRN
jgi:hypothetical protein